MTISQLIAELQEILDREYDVPVRVHGTGLDRRIEAEDVEYREGYEETLSGGGWDTSHVLIKQGD